MKPIQLSCSLLLGASIALTSCIHTKQLPQRYNSLTTRNYEPGKDSIKYFVTVNGYAARLEQQKVKPEPAKDIFSLSPEGQRQHIESMAYNEKISDDIFVRLSEKIGEEKSEIAEKDRTRFRRRVVLSVNNLSVAPASRILKLSVSLSMNAESGANIISCNKVTSAHQAIDLGRPDYSASKGLTGKGNLPVVKNASNPTTNDNAKKGILNRNTKVREVPETVPAAAMLLSSYIAGNSLNITEESGQGNDLAGNVLADVDFDFEGEKTTKVIYSFSGLQNRDRTTAKPNDIVTNQYRMTYPVVTKDVTLSLAYEATVRRMVAGGKTTSRSDDDIEIITGRAAGGDIVVVPKGQFRPKFWVIADGANTLEIEGPLKKSELLFDNYESAMTFILWLKRSSADILVNNKISSGDYQLTISGGMSTLTDSFLKNCTLKAL